MNEYLKKNYLRICRRKMGLTQEDLAFLICLDRSARVSRLENGHTRPTAAECVVFEKLFARSLHEIWPQWATELERDADLRIEHFRDRIKESPSPSIRKRRRLEEASRALWARITRKPDAPSL